MAGELITPHSEFPSALIQNVYQFLVDFAPEYVQCMDNIVRAFQMTMYDQYGSYGWGTFTVGKMITYPEVQTGRGFCPISADFLGRLILRRFPMIEVRKRIGRAYEYNPLANPLTEQIAHHWLAVADPTVTADIRAEDDPTIQIMCGTIKQIKPNGPYIHFSSDIEANRSVFLPGFLSIKCRPYQDTYTDWFDFSLDPDIFEEQKAACTRLMKIAGA